MKQVYGERAQEDNMFAQESKSPQRNQPLSEITQLLKNSPAVNQ